MFRSCNTIYIKSCFSIFTNSFKQLLIFYLIDIKSNIISKYYLKNLFVNNYLLNKMLVSL